MALQDLLFKIRSRFDSAGTDDAKRGLGGVEHQAERTAAELVDLAQAANRSEREMADLARDLGITEAQLRDVQRESGATVADLRRLADAADDVGTGTGIDNLRAKLSDLAGPAGIGAALTALGALIAKGAGTAQELREMSIISGLATDDLQAMSDAAKAGGGSVDDVADAAREMQLRLAEAAKLGTGPAVDALKLLGLTLDDIPLRDTNAAFALLRDRISRVEDPATRLFVAEELLGGSVERLNSLLAISSDELDGHRRLTEAEIETAARAQAAFTDVAEAVETLSVLLAEELAPVLESITDHVDDGRVGFDALKIAIKAQLDPLGSLRDAVSGSNEQIAEIPDHVAGAEAAAQRLTDAEWEAAWAADAMTDSQLAAAAAFDEGLGSMAGTMATEGQRIAAGWREQRRQMELTRTSLAETADAFDRHIAGMVESLTRRGPDLQLRYAEILGLGGGGGSGGPRWDPVTGTWITPGGGNPGPRAQRSAAVEDTRRSIEPDHFDAGLGI